MARHMPGPRRVEEWSVTWVALVRPFIGVFGVYVGLLASGYDLARVPAKDPLQQVLKAVRAAQWPLSAVEYFAKARQSRGGVNPYWPRAAMLVEACFYLGTRREYRHTDELELLRAIAAFPVSDEEKGAGTVEWVWEFPRNYSSLTETEMFPALWASYLGALEPRLRRFENAASSALESFAAITGTSDEDLPDLVVIPNPLQAPQVADFVRREGTIHVIVAEPRMASLIHEILHDVFGPVLRANKPEIVGHRHLLRPVLTSMRRMQYAWGNDDESWFRVFEDSFMRAAAIWIEFERSSGEAARQAALHAAQGFVYVPAMLRCLQNKWPGSSGAADFVSACLEACSGQAGRLGR